MSERSIFIAASEIDDCEKRRAYLDTACTGDAAMRRRIERLLRLHEQNVDFLKHPAAFTATVDSPSVSERPGTEVGHYKLLQEIGEGGFGVVYLAEQREPVRRKVALKVVKPGMDTREVISRFETERQALAVMDHPNIAHVLEAGATESGRPYFVMELVNGVPVTEYCDQHDLTTRDRLELFVGICHAVQHAHQKGIIHRDIKPSNILIAMRDGAPVPKIIDFGIAKAIHGQLAGGKATTGYGQMVGTPLYMSPEQAEINGPADVDTRSDIYSLGVLLYELLTGSTPFDKERLKGANFDEVRRLIREEEPTRPSTRISTLGKAATTVSTHRKTDPAKLQETLRRELDWIVMKALDKDRICRYQTATDFARDIQRYLSDEPVEACPPSAFYRWRKFVRRNRLVLGIATTIAVAFVVSCLSLAVAYRGKAETFQARLDRQAAERARHTEREARLAAERAHEDARIEALVQEGLKLSNGLLPDFPTAIENLTEVLDNRPDDAAAYLYRGSTYYRWGRPNEAIQDLERALELSPEDNLAAHQLLAVVARQLDREEEVAQHLALAEGADPDTVEALTMQALAFNDRRGLGLLTKAIEKQPFDPVLYRHRGQLASYVVFQEGATNKTVQMGVSDLEKALKAFPGDPTIFDPLCCFLLFQWRFFPDFDSRKRCKEVLDEWIEAAPADEECLRYLMLYHLDFTRNLGKAIEVGLKAHNLYPRDPNPTLHVASIYEHMRRFDDAEDFLTKTIELSHNPEFSEFDPIYPVIRRGVCRIRLGQRQAARKDLDKAREANGKSEWMSFYWPPLIRGYQQLGNLNAAESLALEWVAQRPDMPQPRQILAENYVKQDRWDRALLELSRAIDLDAQAFAVYDCAFARPEALTLITKAIEKRPFDPVLHRHRGRTAFHVILHEGGTKETVQLGISDLEKALEAFPADRTILNPLCHILIFYSRLIPEIDAKTRCKELLDSWLEARPNDPDGLRYSMCYYKHLVENQEKALEVGFESHGLFPHWPIFTIQIGECYQRLRRFEEAENYFTKTIELQRNPRWSHIQRGHCRIELGRPEAAREDFDQACESGEKSAWPQFEWRSLILGYCQLGDLETPETLAREWVALRPRSSEPHHRLAMIYSKQKRWDEGLLEYSRAINLQPEDAVALNHFAWLLATCPEPAHRDSEKAVSLAEKAVGLNPNVITWNTLGVARYRTRDFAGAIKALQKSEDLNSDGHIAVNDFFLAMAHWQQGNQKEARDSYQWAVEWMEQKEPDSKFLLRIRTEAEKLMGIDDSSVANPAAPVDGLPRNPTVVSQPANDL